MKNITNEKNLLKDYVDNLKISEENYNEFVKLLNIDDNLFVKIIEEIKNNNLKINDFKRLFDDLPNYATSIETSMEAQEKLYREYSLLFDRLKELNIISEGQQLENLISLKEFVKNNKIISVVDIEKQNILYSLFTEEISDPFKNFYRTTMLNEIIKNIEDNNPAVENMLLSVHDFMVPVDYEHIEINNTDKQFMIENNLDEATFKKIKSLAAFTANKYKE